MTTPDPDKPADGGPGSGRRTRPEAQRSGPIRSGAGTRQPGPAAARGDPAANLDDAVAQAIHSSYDIFNEAVAQSREAGGRMRQGDLSMNPLPVDIASISLKAIAITRQLSTATLDLCEQMVEQMNASASPPPPGEVAAKIPPFRKTTPDQPERQPEYRSSPNGGEIAYETHFTGKGRAVAHTSAIARPTTPTKAEDLSVHALAPVKFEAMELTGSAFAMDLASGKLTVEIDIPRNQPAGIYSGLIMAKGQDIPLGLVSVEVLAGS